MQASHDGRLVCIEQPELLEHVFLLTRDKETQGALLRTSKAWAAVGTRCSPLEVSVGLSGCTCWPLGKRWRGGTAQSLPSGGLPAAAIWLAQQRRMVTNMHLHLDGSRYPGMLRHREAGPLPLLPDAGQLREQASTVLQVATALCSLDVRSELDVWWLPRMNNLTHLSLDFGWDPADYQDGTGPLDCLQHAAPHLRSLTLGSSRDYDDDDPPFLSGGAALPPGITRMHINGQVDGLGPHLRQLEWLSWHPPGRSTWLLLPMDAIEGLSQASRLTYLVLSAPSPSSILAFFDSLARLTALRSLTIQCANEDGCITLLNPRYYLHAEFSQLFLCQMLPSALAALTALTHLSLTGHDMPACPATVARLPSLKSLSLLNNEGLTQLPHGPWPALEELHVDSEVVLAALADAPAQPLGGANAAGEGAGTVGAAESCHALWGLTRLTCLCGLYGLTKEERQDKKQAIRRLLPQLHHLG